MLLSTTLHLRLCHSYGAFTPVVYKKGTLSKEIKFCLFIVKYVNTDRYISNVPTKANGGAVKYKQLCTIGI